MLERLRGLATRVEVAEGGHPSLTLEIVEHY
jgi:hypothetical protein